MNALLDYFLKANLYGLLFAGCYWLLLRRHTFFRLNRAYLLASTALSLVLPLASLPTQTVETLPTAVPVGIITLPMAQAAPAPVEMAPVAAQSDWEQIGLIAYGLIALFLVVRFSVRITRLLWLIRQSPRQAQQDYILVEPADPTIPTFSFFRYVILNPADTHNDLIIRHELVHVRQHHSADVVGLSLLQAVCWASPALWLIERLLRQVHEFLADKQVHQPTVYAKFLIDYSFGTQPHVGEPDLLTNSFFNPSLLKQRIVMLHQKATTRWALGKYALVFPLAFGLLAMTTAREKITAIVSQATDESITVSGRVTSTDGKPLPGANVVIKNTTQGTTTDSDGRYKLITVSKDASIVFSFVGFIIQEVKVNGQTTLNVSMMLQTSGLNEVVVVGYEPFAEPSPPLGATATKPNSQTSPTGEVFTIVEQQPEFSGGMQALGQYLSRNLRYPKEAQRNKTQGRVFVQFVISQTGDIRDLRVLKGIGSGCDEEAVRVVSQMPKWNPGKQNGKAVAVQYKLPIQFMLEKREDKRTGQVDPDIFKPTGSPIGDFPTVRDVNYPNQPRLTLVKVPDTSFKADTTPQPDSGKKMTEIIDNSKNGRFALYNDLNTGLPALTDSNSALRIRTYGRPLSQFGVEPLFIIDGVESTKDVVDKLDAKNIQTITVLKNGAAATYGPKAEHGAVIITTKKK